MAEGDEAGEDGDILTCEIALPVISDEEDEDDLHVMEWEAGLPSSEDLIPLSQLLITPELASAFSISLEPSRTAYDVARASRMTLSSFRTLPIPSFPILRGLSDSPTDAEDSRKGRKFDPVEEPEDDHSARTLKRPRLVWTPHLHKRFIDVVTHLGIKNAFPKTIMQLMNVEGLTRENVASHLQKYRLYLKRMQGTPNQSPSLSDQVFSSTPSLHELAAPISLPYASPYLPFPVFGLPHGGEGNGHLEAMTATRNRAPSESSYHGFESHSYKGFGEQWRNCSGDSLRSIVSYYHVAPNDK